MRYNNEGCATGNDPFGRTKQLVAMENGPFYAVKTIPYIMITSGGLNSIGGMGHGNCLTWGKVAAEVIAEKLSK